MNNAAPTRYIAGGEIRTGMLLARTVNGRLCSPADSFLVISVVDDGPFAVLVTTQHDVAGIETTSFDRRLSGTTERIAA